MNISARGFIAALVLGVIYMIWCQVTDTAIEKWIADRRHNNNALKMMGE